MNAELEQCVIERTAKLMAKTMEIKATKISQDAAREYAESIINTVHEPLVVLD